MLPGVALFQASHSESYLLGPQLKALVGELGRDQVGNVLAGRVLVQALRYAARVHLVDDEEQPVGAMCGNMFQPRMRQAAACRDLRMRMV